MSPSEKVTKIKRCNDEGVPLSRPPPRKAISHCSLGKRRSGHHSMPSPVREGFSMGESKPEGSRVIRQGSLHTSGRHAPLPRRRFRFRTGVGSPGTLAAPRWLTPARPHERNKRRSQWSILTVGISGRLARVVRPCSASGG